MKIFRRAINSYKKVVFVFTLLSGGLLAKACFALSSPLQIPPPPPSSATLPVFMIWVFNAGMAIGTCTVIIAFVVSGALFALSTTAPSMRNRAKEWLSGGVTGLLIFTLLYLIITTIYPPLAYFGVGAPLVTTTLSGSNQTPGVYFYDGAGCSGTPYTSIVSVPNFGAATQAAVGSVQIVPDTDNDIDYISVVYNNQNYFGQCQYIDPDVSCDNINLNKTLSASVYEYSSSGSGTVIFYRNGAFNKEGGYLTLSGSDIGEIYEGDLKDLKFTGESVGSDNDDDCTVPKDQQDCTMYNTDGECTEYECPSLTNGNIGSIEIDGDYLVILTFADPNDAANSWSYCQAYPDSQDIGNVGPKQIKWDQINTTKGVFLNHLVIIPIERP